jgi:hypothetical protein
MSTASILVMHPALDAQVLEAFYREQLGLIYRYVYHQVGNRQEAEDLTSFLFCESRVLPAVRGRPRADEPLAAASGSDHNH